MCTAMHAVSQRHPAATLLLAISCHIFVVYVLFYHKIVLS